MAGCLLLRGDRLSGTKPAFRFEVSRFLAQPLHSQTRMNIFIPRRERRGFTVVEIMIVVTIIALIASIGVPSYVRARKRSQAVSILDAARSLEGAISLYAIEHNKTGVEAISAADIPSFLPYIKINSPLYTTLPNDILGNPFTLSTLDSPPKISAATFSVLSDVAPIDFWSPYNP
jgi:prepilin-type N-terminal cleavage/methylation domain-containing protein